MRLLLLVILLGLVNANQALATTTFSGGIWYNFSYLTETDESFFGDEALVLYIDGKPKTRNENWRYSAEVRFGPGGFSDKENNSSGDYSVIHKAWVAFDFGKKHSLTIGKSQVPFAWKTENFWPGDMFQAAYGDQMDVGLKLDADYRYFDMSLAYFHADDWGNTSTDSTDDNRHWGSSTTYRKVRTWVADFRVPVVRNQTVGLSLQSGELEELMTGSRDTDGQHQAAAVYYLGDWQKWQFKAEYIWGERDLPNIYVSQTGLPETIENQRLGFEFIFDWQQWQFILDATWAFPDTQGSDADTIVAYAPGVKFDYGPGWIYLEYLTQDGWIDRDMQIHEGDFSAWYLTFDFYF
ncbi:hypothetical protein [Thalassotalea fusca]